MNRCAVCGRFASWRDLELIEARRLTMYGDLIEEWFFAHKRKCPARRVAGG